MVLLFSWPGIGQTGLWPKQTQPANCPAIGLSGKTFQLSANQQDVRTERSERIYRRMRSEGRLTIATLFYFIHLCRRNLGGKLGVSITETLGVENMGDLTRFSQAQLEQHFGDKTG